MCDAKTGHSLIGDAKKVVTREAREFAPTDPDESVVVGSFRCAACNGISVALINDRVAPGINLTAWMNNLDDNEFRWAPTAGSTRKYPDVPSHIADAATEAYECHVNHHYRAAILLARSVIEATAKDKGITSGTLYKKIEELAKQDFIRPRIKAVAHGIRDYGNDMAHGDFVEPVVAEESEIVIQLMGEILDEIFQSPARLDRVQAAVDARKSSTATD
jgi:hypothetical protein